MASDPIIQLSSHRKKRLLWALGVVAFYTIFGFLILPLIVRSVAVKQLSRELGREVTIRQVRLNPYVLSGTIRGLLIKDKDGEAFISFDEAYANFQLVSFFGKPWRFKELRVVQPYVRVQINKDYSLNFSDLIEKLSQPGTPSSPPGKPKPLYLEVGRIQIGGARASLTDLTPNAPFRRIIGPVEITLTEFHTAPNDKNPYAFSGTTDGGEKFAWSGHFFVDPIRSAGDLSLEGLSIPKYAPVFQDLVRFEIRDGIIDTRSSYEVALTGSNYVASVSNAFLSLKALKVGEKNASENIAELDELSVGGVSADLVARKAEIGQVNVNGARLALRRDKEKTVNVLELARPSDTATNAAGSVLFLQRAVTNVFAELLRSTNLASVVLHKLDVTNGSLSWDDLANSRPVHVMLHDMTASAREISNLPGSNQTATLALRWNTNGTVRVEASGHIGPLGSDLNVSVQGFELRPLDPYLEPFLDLYLTDGRLDLQAKARLRASGEGLPEIGVQGDARLDDFSTVDSQANEDLLKWKSLQVSGIDATLAPPALTIKEVSLLDLVARVAVRTNRLINVLAALKVGVTNSATPAETPTADAPLGKGGLGQKLGRVLRQALASNTNAAGQLALPRVAVNTISLSNAQAQFSDRSVQPELRVSMQELNGTISGISSEELKRADVHFTGKAIRTGTFEINGKINPLNQQAPTEVQVTFREVDLSPTSPYAGKYLGYRLSRGKLDLQINCEISQRHIKSTNEIVLDQLTLGEKVNSPDATSLPVRLGVALLKDRNGRIELEVPIDGSLDDPQFHFGKAIVGVLSSLITKLVTSPFAALGALFGSDGEEVSYQDFAPGSSELSAANLNKLKSLIDGLYERPALQLEIEGGFDPVADRDGLRQQKLELELRRQKWESLTRSEQARIAPEQVTLSPSERAERLRSAYAKALQSSLGAGTSESDAQSKPSGGKATKAGLTATASGSQKGATALLGQSDLPTPDELESMKRSLTAATPVTDEELKDLATKRAKAVQQKILDSGRIEASRLILSDQSSAPSTNNSSRVYFRLQ